MWERDHSPAAPEGKSGRAPDLAKSRRGTGGGLRRICPSHGRERLSGKAALWNPSPV